MYYAVNVSLLHGVNERTLDSNIIVHLDDFCRLVLRVRNYGGWFAVIVLVEKHFYLIPAEVIFGTFSLSKFTETVLT